MDAPRTDPVGRLVVPEGFARTPRSYSKARRIAAGALVAVLLAVVSATTAASLGRYCLTTDAANTSALPHAGRPGAG